MKFQYRPNTCVIDYEKLVKICVFDENGFYETDNPKKIEWLRKHAKGVNVVEEATKKPENKLPTDEFYNCKKCNFKTDNKGELLAHYRTEHPKK